MTTTAHVEYSFRLTNEHVQELPDGSLVVSGYASTYDADRVGDTVVRAALEEALEAYMRNPVLLFDHRHSLPAGAVTKARVDERGLFIEATVSKPGEHAPAELHNKYDLVRRGLSRAFSIGGVWVRDAGRRLVSIDLREISVAALPVNASTLMGSYAKAFGDELEDRELTIQRYRLQAIAGLTEAESRAMSIAKIDDLHARHHS